MNNWIFIIIFLLLWIGPIIPGVIIAKRKNRSPHWFWLGIWPGVGLWVLIIMLIIKKMKICSKCGRKVVNDAIVCPFCSNPYNELIQTEEERENDKKRKRIKTITTVSIVLVIMIGLVSVISISVFATFTNSEPYKYSLELLENNAEVKEYLGENYRRTGLISGSLSTNGDASGNASISYKLKGKNGVSRVYINAVKENGVWNYQKIVFYNEKDKSKSIDLLQIEK